ncbi:hypothetical protein EG327_005386 [Venturia inaequalis]|uniref:Histone deacetylase interacting domain-containing protein n=1 Tax=Venturia inaequalis TaxID=5025 RepID=A0A8H3V5W8_VENIN|nr:hypothetical protein EG327_005386 [Venturia inaequalis]
MNQPGRDGWHPSQSNAPSAQQQQQQSQPPPQANSAPVLPPPSVTFFSNPAHNLPGLAGLAQTSQNAQNQAAQHAEQQATHQLQGPQQQQSGHPFNGIGQHQLQPHPSIENDRERESRDLEELARRNAEQDMRERQHREQQAAHENHAGAMQIHQPVAVPPSVRTIHGPNGLLGNPNSAGGSVPPPTSIVAAQGLFSTGPIHQNDPNSRLQQAPSISLQASALNVFAPAGAPQPNGSMNQAQQPILNDALSYLDQVKVQFADHPDVYNRFLDIMKDFKSGAIDTPGVIDRVSQLFAGNPGLIQGFNTFLPPGYKIECGTGDDPNSIRVTTPMGTTVSSMPAARPLGSPRPLGINGNIVNANERALFDAQGRMNWPQHPQATAGAQDSGFSPEGRNGVNGAQMGYPAQGGPPSHAPHSPESYREQQAQSAAIHQQEQRNVAHLQNAASQASAGVLPGRALMSSPGDGITPLQAHLMNGASPGAQQAMVNGDQKRGPVEFNHAISYVNKIKNRFAQQPDIYKQFLEILQTYQRESKPIQDVYAQVTRLFETATDLLEDFKQFLPESAAANQNKNLARATGEDAFPLSSTRNEPGYSAAVHSNTHLHQTPRPDHSKVPPMGLFAPTPSSNREHTNKRKRNDRQGAATMNNITFPDASNLGPKANLNPVSNGNKRFKTAQGPKVPAVPEIPSSTPSLVPPLPQPLPPTVTTSATSDDVAFFDRARKHIGNKALFGEFLKLCNLYTNELISVDYYNHKSESFLGGAPELLAWLRNFVGSGPVADTEITNVVRTASMDGKILLSNCRGLGPSYRLLPKSETNKKCSGRDELCNSVLNNEWVSHPTWASEDSGFVAHRKNVHEEGLHRIEEERHDYDYHMEICARTIQLLEPIAQALATSTADSRRNFSLDTKLGGQSEAIYKRVVLKVYGRERGLDVLENLFNRPYDVVPVLLARLKTKYQEWKAAQIQWERVWRTQTNQMFYKSLDHQGVATRVGDKRQFWPKQLVNEVTVKYMEGKRKREVSSAPIPTYQFKYNIPDKEVLLDAARLLTTYVDQNLSTEYAKLEQFIKEFLATFFFLDLADFGQHGTQTTGSPAVDMDAPSPGTEDGRTHKSKQHNLYRSALDRGRSTRRENEGSASESRGTSPAAQSVLDEEMADALPSPAPQDLSERVTWFTHPMDENLLDGKNVKPDQKFQRTRYAMYGNGSIYCFIRLFCILYERLAAIKADEADARLIVKRAMQHKPATELGWIERKPSDFFKDLSPSASLYSQMLGLFEQLIRGDIEITFLEEALRRYYLQDGWQLYSLDKLLGSAARFAVTMLQPDAKEKTAELLSLYKKDRARGKETSYEEDMNYRRQADKHFKTEGETFRMTYDEAEPAVEIQLFKPDDPTHDPTSMSAADIWKSYISSYENRVPTEGVSYHRILSYPYMRRTYRQQWGEDQAAASQSDPGEHVGDALQFRVGMKDYKLMFDAETSETIFTTWSKTTDTEVSQAADRRGAKASEGFQANAEWMKGATTNYVDEMKQAFSSQWA